ncbi:MAG: Lar family restriction alleviation protein [Oscillospiraceae bacterium]
MINEIEKKLNDEKIKEKTMRNSIKPCPFCGAKLNDFHTILTVTPVHSDDYLIAKLEHKQIIGSDSYYAVCCIICGSSGKSGYTKEEAIKNWNRRTNCLEI